jgi:sodium-dependent dicarboxylate transporter 2/3/5
MIPLILGLVHPPEFSEQAATAIVLASAFGASFGFMLPVSTPPNAIVYATGRVPSGEMLKTGALFDLCGGLLIIGYFLFMR